MRFSLPLWMNAVSMALNDRRRFSEAAVCQERKYGNTAAPEICDEDVAITLVECNGARAVSVRGRLIDEREGTRGRIDEVVEDCSVQPICVFARFTHGE
jgi:hypothetical protein